MLGLMRGRVGVLAALGLLACVNDKSKATPIERGESSSPVADDGASSLGPESGRKKVAFACDAIELRRAWRFRGGAATAANEAVAELAAFHLYTRVSEGFAFRLRDENGAELDTHASFVRAAPDGAPLDRFHEQTSAYGGPMHVVAIAAVPKGATKLTVLLLDPSTSSTKRCTYPAVLEENRPAWPPLPRYRAVRYAKTPANTIVLLYEATNVLPQERPAPDLLLVVPPADQERLHVKEVRAGQPLTMATTDANGEPVRADRKARSRFVVAGWDWREDGTVPGLPNQYTAGDRLAPLPPMTAWPLSKALNEALDASGAIRKKYGQAGQSIFVHGDKTELDEALEAGTLFIEPW
jgi:hypothetical protein